MILAAFIELIAKIKQKNNGTFKLVDAQDVECNEDKGLDEVLNEKLDKNQGVENAGKTMVVGADGNLVVGDSSPKNVYTKEEVDYLLDDKMDKPYYDIAIADDTTIENTLAGNFKIDSIEGGIYQAEESGIVPTPERPIPIRSKKITVDGKVVELRSLKESVNIFSLDDFYIKNISSCTIEKISNGIRLSNSIGVSSAYVEFDFNLKANKTYTISFTADTTNSSFTLPLENRLFLLCETWWGSPHWSITVGEKGVKTYKQTFTPTVDCTVWLSSMNRGTAEQEGYVDFTNIMLVEGGSAPSSYVTPTVRDYKIVDHVNKTAKIVRNVGVVNLNDVKWNYGSRDLNHIRLYGNTPAPLKYVAQKTYCNIFESFYEKFNYSKQGIYCGNTSGGTTISVMVNSSVFNGYGQDEFDGLFKEYINNPNAITLYPLATKTEEEIAYSADDTSEVGYSRQDTTSPSPDIPSAVQGVEGVDILKTGKNLLNIVDYNKLTANGITSYMSNDGSIKYEGTSTANYVRNVIDNLFLKKGFYTLKKFGNSNYRVFVRSKTISGKVYVSSSQPSTTFEIENDDNVYLYCSIDNGTSINDIFYPQIEVGNIETAYETYQSQQILITPPQPLYENDVANVESGEYEYEKQKYIVTGNEAFENDYQSSAGYYGRYFNLENGNGILTEKIWCNYLSYMKESWSLASEGCSQNVRRQIHLKFSNDRLGITDNTSLEEKRLAFANYLKQLYASENPLYVVVKVAKTTRPIPEEDLTKLKSLKTEQGVTNIFVGGEVKPTINARYPRDLALVQQQLEQKVLLMSETLTATQAKLLLQGGN